MANHEENFIKLVKDWIDPDIRENPNKFMKKRQERLKTILDEYDGKSIPIEHFTDKMLISKGKNCPRNRDAFPVVYAYLCNVLKRDKNLFTLREDINLTERNIPRNSFIPTEVLYLYK